MEINSESKCKDCKWQCCSENQDGSWKINTNGESGSYKLVFDITDGELTTKAEASVTVKHSALYELRVFDYKIESKANPQGWKSEGLEIHNTTICYIKA